MKLLTIPFVYLLYIRGGECMCLLEKLKKWYRFAAIVLAIFSLFFTVNAISSIKDDYSAFFNGIPAEIFKLYYEQSNDQYVMENKELGFGYTAFITTNTLKFPNGTPVHNGISENIKSGMNKSVSLAIDSRLPDAIGVPKSLKEALADYFKPKLKFKYNNKKTNKLKANIGETISLEVYLDKKLVSIKEEAFISASYDADVIELVGNNTFKVISNGETEIGMLYFDGEKNYIKKIKVLVSR